MGVASVGSFDPVVLAQCGLPHLRYGSPVPLQETETPRSVLEEIGLT